MWDTFLTLYRGDAAWSAGTPLAKHLWCRVEQLGDAQTVQFNRAHGTDVRLLFTICTYGWYPAALVQQGDVLVDERETDPDTGAGYVYRVNSHVKNATYDHQEFKTETIVGN